MKPKTMILMVVAVACGLGASYMTSRYLKAARPEQPEAQTTRPVLVAKASIPAWTPIKDPEKLFEVKQFPESTAPRTALSDLSEVRGQRFRNTLSEGKPVTRDDLLTKEQMTLVDQLKHGQRAVAIKVTPESIVSGFVLPGTRVDVICTTRGNDPQSKLLLQNMLVLAIDAQDQRAPETKTILGQNVTLAATPEEATRLTLGQSVGELRLMLKSQNDTSQIDHAPTRWSDLDKPLLAGRPKEPEQPKVEATPQAPPLPPVLEDPKEEPVATVKPPKPHVLIIDEAGKRTKHTFHPKVEEEEDGPDASGEAGGPAKPDLKKPEPKKPEPKAEPKKEAPKPAPKGGSPFGPRTTRTGRVQ